MPRSIHMQASSDSSKRPLAALDRELGLTQAAWSRFRQSMPALGKTRPCTAPRTRAERSIEVLLNGEDGPMSKQILRVLSQEHQPDTAQQRELPIGETPHADAEMTRVLKTAPLRKAADPTSGVITFWRHDPLHDIVKPMADHVIMAFPDEPVAYFRHRGFALRVVNRTSESVPFAACDSSLSIVVVVVASTVSRR